MAIKLKVARIISAPAKLWRLSLVVGLPPLSRVDAAAISRDIVSNCQTIYNIITDMTEILI